MVDHENALMQSYLGIKEIMAMPMTRLEYNIYRDWQGPDGEDPEDDGYLVEYVDSPNANHPDHKGYISWSPKDVFERAYQSPYRMDFSAALRLLKRGKKVARAGWNGKDMFVFKVQGSTFAVNRAPLNEFYAAGTMIDYRSHYDMRTADGTVVPWVASQTDLDAEDWCIVD